MELIEQIKIFVAFSSCWINSIYNSDWLFKVKNILIRFSIRHFDYSNKCFNQTKYFVACYFPIRNHTIKSYKATEVIQDFQITQNTSTYLWLKVVWFCCKAVLITYIFLIQHCFVRSNSILNELEFTYGKKTCSFRKWEIVKQFDNKYCTTDSETF